MCTNPSAACLEALSHENAVLARQLGAAQARCTQAIDEQRARCERQQTELVRLRAELIGRDTMIAMLREELRALEVAVPALRARQELAGRVEQLTQRNQSLQREAMLARQEAQCQADRALELEQALTLARAAAVVDEAQVPGDEGRDRQVAIIGAPERAGTRPATDGTLARPVTSPPLVDRSILCVGGRPASVPLYRRLIEDRGGRFLHHDGGEEECAARLDSTLAAADLVICQTGCISHGAYWRVKDHCKRTGKRCVFVETPSGAGMRRALQALGPPEQAEAPAR